MPLKAGYAQASEVTPIPYPPNRGGGGSNKGYSDLRGRPEAASRVAEAEASPALRTLLVELAQPGSPLDSLGCDLGEHTNSKVKRRPEVAGGYIQVTAAHRGELSAETYQAYAQAVEAELRKRAGEAAWTVTFRLRWVEFQFTEPWELAPSIDVHFWAAARDRQQARIDRELLIAAVGRSLLADDALSLLTELGASESQVHPHG